MKRFTLLIAFAFALIATPSFAGSKDKSDQDELLRRSTFAEPDPFPSKTSFPMPFDETGNVKTPEKAAVSTGYYFVDSQDKIQFPGQPQLTGLWKPSFQAVDTNNQSNLWYKILRGPRLLPKTYWEENPEEGLRFFRNPALPTTPGPTKNFWMHGEVNATDSTDNAIAGPISIGFPFYFNGLRFDSMYVSTNGVIALTNRRYFYDQEGNRFVPTAAKDCYDPMSMDWFERARTGEQADLDGDGNNDGVGTGDPLADDFGYLRSVCGGDEANPTGGIRNPRSGDMGTLIPDQHKSALIAPFWGDLHISQYADVQDKVDEYGKVWFKRSIDNSKMTIYFVNAQLKGQVATPRGPAMVLPNRRPGDNNFITASAHVVLNRNDSTVTIHYKEFQGFVVAGGQPFDASIIYRYNTTCGVRGFARHINHPTPVPKTDANYPWAGEYEQTTHYFSSFNKTSHPSRQPFPFNNLAIRFKQWQNTVRVIDIQYMVRKLDPNSDLEFTEKKLTKEVTDYELLAGEARIGAIQPVALIQNISNEIQGPNGVNFVPQDLEFRTRFKIVNEITGQTVYNKTVPITDYCLGLVPAQKHLCNNQRNVKVYYSTVENNGGNYEATNVADFKATGFDGVPPYGFVQVYFPEFEANENSTSHIGRLTAYIIAEPVNPKTNEKLGDMWPFDDTTRVSLFVMKRLPDFSDDVTEFHLASASIPSVWKWVDIGAEVVPGTLVSHHPLAPRGKIESQMEDQWVKRDVVELESPCIKMNRVTLGGGPHPKDGEGYSGDQLRSFPIDLRGKHNAVLSLSVARVSNPGDKDWKRGFGDNNLVGPEPRTLANANILDVWDANGNPKSVAKTPDEIVVELAQPSPDQIFGITNIAEERWRNHPRRAWGGATPDPVTNMAALTVYGAGGYMLGFKENDIDSSYSRPNDPAGAVNGLRADIYDDGFDEDFKKYFVSIPNYVINSAQEGAKNFRFRIRVRATDDKKCMLCIQDDDDDFFVDNVRLLFPNEQTDIEVSSVKIEWPYTMVPASQATEIPIKVRFSNNTSKVARNFEVKVKIYKGRLSKQELAFHQDYKQRWIDDQASGSPSIQVPVYCRKEPLNTLNPRVEVEYLMPKWDASVSGDGMYTIQANVQMETEDLEPKNDTTYTYVNLKFGDSYAYDSPDNPKNEVDARQFTGITGRGLNMFGSNTGGTGTRTRYTAGSWTPINSAAGAIGGNGSGQIATKFVVIKQDTIKGFQVYFSYLSQAKDDIRFSIYRDAKDAPGGDYKDPTKKLTIIAAQRGVGKFDSQGKLIDPTHGKFNEYITYELPEPVVLAAGTYWVAVAQLGSTGMELGASATRMGMRVTSVSFPGQTGPLGTTAFQLMIDKSFRKYDENNNFGNNNCFAAENTATSNTWYQFTPRVGNPAFGHLSHYGISPVDNQTATLTRGGWIPMLRPYFGKKVIDTKKVEQWCPEDLAAYPVEMVNFNAIQVGNTVQLDWATSSEENNSGFHIEKRIASDFGAWDDLEFVPTQATDAGADYNFTDTDVAFGTKYQYRLRMVDNDGSQQCTTSEIRTVELREGLTLSATAYPNPVVGKEVTFKVTSPADNATLQVMDIFGNIIYTRNIDKGANVIPWNNIQATSGTYVYRLTSGNEVVNGNLTIVK